MRKCWSVVLILVSQVPTAVAQLPEFPSAPSSGNSSPPDPTTPILKFTGAGYTDIQEMAFCLNNTAIVAACGDHKLRLLSSIDGTLLGTLGELDGHSGGIVSVSVSPSGRYAATYSWFTDPSVKIWDLQEQRLLRTIRSQLQVNGAEFSPIEDRICIVYRDKDDTIVQVHPLTSGAKAISRQLQDWPKCRPAWSHDGRTIAVCVAQNVGCVYMLEMLGLQTIKCCPLKNDWMENHPFSLAFVADNHRVLAHSDSRTHTYHKGRVLRSEERFHGNCVIDVQSPSEFFLEHGQPVGDSNPRLLQILPRARAIVLGHREQIRIINQDSREVIAALPLYGQQVRSLHVSPDEGHLVALQSNSEIAVWDLQALLNNQMRETASPVVPITQMSDLTQGRQLKAVFETKNKGKVYATLHVQEIADHQTVWCAARLDYFQPVGDTKVEDGGLVDLQIRVDAGRLLINIQRSATEPPNQQLEGARGWLLNQELHGEFAANGTITAMTAPATTRLTLFAQRDAATGGLFAP